MYFILSLFQCEHTTYCLVSSMDLGHGYSSTILMLLEFEGGTREKILLLLKSADIQASVFCIGNEGVAFVHH